ncbi:MAG: FAD-binding protein, partial [Gammaproteobacteria bacterium]
MSLFVDKLKRLLPKELIIADEELLRAYECDALSAYRQLPSYVVMPESVDQVQAIMRLCHQENVPVVARGAGTGLSGGAMPVEDGLLLSLAKFNQIVHLDPDQRIARVQPGVRNISVSEAVEKYGLFYAPDPSSHIACTIGGNVEENSGGVHCLKYGLTVHNILAVKLITVTGDLLEIGGNALDSAGYDLLALMTGSEGMLGVIVEVTLKLISKPLNNRVLLAAFDEI